MMMGFGLLVLFLLGGGLIAVLLAGAGLASRKGAVAQWLGGTRQSTPREVLDARYARGEISLQEYETMRGQIDR